MRGKRFGTLMQIARQLKVYQSENVILLYTILDIKPLTVHGQSIGSLYCHTKHDQWPTVYSQATNPPTVYGQSIGSLYWSEFPASKSLIGR